MKKRDGFLYILRHPNRIFTDYGLRDDEHLFKIGVTTRTVKIRLKQHNTNFTKAAGMVVKETGRPGEVQGGYSVQDEYVTESIFWGNTPFADIPFMGGVEICPMKAEDVQKAMEAVLRLCNGTAKVELSLDEWIKSNVNLLLGWSYLPQQPLHSPLH